MNMQTMTPTEGMLLVTLLTSGILLFFLSNKHWRSEKALNGTGGAGLHSRHSCVTLSVSLLALAFMSGPVPAKEMFALPTNGGYDFYQVDGSIQSPDLWVSGSQGEPWPGLESDLPNKDFAFMDTKVKDSSLIIDPGFRMSLTHRIISVAGRISWLSGLEDIDLLHSYPESGFLDVGRLNRERLTGVSTLVLVSDYQSPVIGYN